MKSDEATQPRSDEGGEARRPSLPSSLRPFVPSSSRLFVPSSLRRFVASPTSAAAGGVYIALGANLADRAATLRAALAELGTQPGVRVLARSGFHETAPVGGPPGQPAYLNAAAELATSQPPRELLATLLAIERRHGRERRERHGPRTLDLDLLIYPDVVLDEPDLALPHPRMWEREFVLRPLGEICDLAQLAARLRVE